jgi:hypothetical protein
MDNKKIIQIINETALSQIEELGRNWNIDPSEAELRYKYAYNDGILDFKNNLIKIFTKNEEGDDGESEKS